jgi:hypothetical protein
MRAKHIGLPEINLIPEETRRHQLSSTVPNFLGKDSVARGKMVPNETTEGEMPGIDLSTQNTENKYL